MRIARVARAAHVAPIALSLSLASAGCGDGDPGETSPDAAPAPARVQIDTVGAPAVVAFRDSGGPWQVARATSPTTFELEVHGHYQLTTVCDDGRGNVVLWQIARMPTDAREIVTPCARDLARVHVFGRMKQGGKIVMDTASDAGSPADWSFSLDAAWGTHDLLALGGDRIAIRRGIEAKSTSVPPLVLVEPPIDLDAEGTDLAPISLAASNAGPSEALTATILLEAASTRALLYSGAPGAAKAAPAAALAATDVQTAIVTARDGAARRSLLRPLRGGEPAPFTLPPRLGPTSFSVIGSQVVASWSTLPPNDLVNLSLIAASDDPARSLRHDLEISTSYIAATSAAVGVIELAGLPGFRPEWMLDPAGPHERVLSVVRFTGDEVAISSVREAHGAAPREAAPPALDRLR